MNSPDDYHQSSRNQNNREAANLPPSDKIYNKSDAYDNGDSSSSKNSLEAGGVALNVWDYEQVLAEIGFGKTQWILLLISGLFTITSMAAQTSVGIIAISSQCEFNMSQGEKGVMMAACVAGIVISTYFWGYLSDVYGRRSVLLYCMIEVTVLQFITMFVTNIWFFNFINLLIGIGFGGLSASLYPYLSEFNISKYRPIVINYSTMFVSIAAIYMPATCWLVLSASWSWEVTDSFSFRPWRLVILFNFLPGLIGIFMLWIFPESPKFLLAQEKQEAAFSAINWIAKFNTGRNLSDILKTSLIHFKTEELGDADLLATSGCSLISNIFKATVPLFHKPYGSNFCIAVMAMFCLFFSSNGMQIWYPEIVNRSSGGLRSGEDGKICEILDESFFIERSLANNGTESMSAICDDTISTKTYIDNMIMGLAFLIGFSILGTLLNPLGRKNVLLAALAGGIISGILLYFVASTTGILVLFCLYILLPGLSISIMCGAMVDIVPTHLRGKAVSMGLTLGRLGVIVASNVVATMLDPHCNGTFAIVTISLLISSLLVWFLPI